MIELSLEPVTVDAITLPLLIDKHVQASVLRLDKIHPDICGNKLFKLKYYLQDAVALGKHTIITFGGPYSNHILATAVGCSMSGLASIGIIRGERPEEFSYTLKSAEEVGMKLFFIPREEFKKRTIPDEIRRYSVRDDDYVINEGGYGQKGKDGAKEILSCCQNEMYTHIICAVGTGTTLAGLITASSDDQHVTGISVLKNNYELESQVKELLGRNTRKNNFSIVHDFHLGGYAKQSTELFSFMNEFYKATYIPTDFVYTGKTMYAFIELVRKGYFPTGSHILIIHSGGLQGNRSLKPGTLMF